MNSETSLTNCKVFGKNPDITFVFPSNGGATLRTERYKLIQKSEVFQKQFTSSSFKAEDRIIITDIFFDTFCELVAHVYEQTIEPHKRILEIILESTSFSISEFELYTAIVDMLKRNYEGRVYSEEDFRKKMGRMIYLIRFPTMTVPELVSCAKKPSLLNERQLLDLQLWVQEKIYTDTLQFFSVVSRTKTPEPIEKAIILSQSPPIYTIQ
uniref:BTB domain-containing protein n=1 Tax=Lutzomyia longipalpis TaxID=7200 RepID=A0A1B0CWT7_LUTLO